MRVDLATGAKVLSSDAEPVAGGLLIAQAEPVPAVRRLATGSETLTMLIR